MAKLTVVTPPSVIPEMTGHRKFEENEAVSDPKFRKKRGKKGNKYLGYLPTLGIGYLASAALRAGHEVQLIDGYAAQLSGEEVVNQILEFGPDVIGISATTPERSEAYALAEHMKLETDVPIILGGPHATVYPDDPLASCAAIDAIGISEGEQIIVEYMEAIGGHRAMADVHGLVWRDGDRLVKNDPIEIEMELDNIAHPAWHLYNFGAYSPLPTQSRRLPVATMMTSRGCSWGKCKFCHTSARYGYRFRRRTPQDVVAEIKTLVRDYGIREVNFRDDNFAVGPRWIAEFCELLVQEDLDITWWCQAIVNTVTEKMLRQMGEAGCFQMLYGFESGNEEILKFIRKNTTREQARQAVKWSHQAGIEVRGNFILGLPTETPEIGQESIDFAIELDLDYVWFVHYKPQYGTELYEMSSQYGTITADKKFFSGSLEVCDYVPDGYGSLSAVSDMVIRGYQQFYYRPRLIWLHIRKMFRSPKGFRRYASHVVQFLRLVDVYRGYSKKNRQPVKIKPLAPVELSETAP